MLFPGTLVERGLVGGERTGETSRGGEGAVGAAGAIEAEADDFG